MTNKYFNNLFGEKPRKPEDKINQFHMDIAKSIQVVTEDLICKIAKNISRETKSQNLCMAGGVALNCVANGRLAREKYFKNIWVQPAASDAGGALGAALAVWHGYMGKTRNIQGEYDYQKSSLLGPSFSNNDIEQFLQKNKIPSNKLSNDDLFNNVADLLSKEKVVGWFQGRMEFGPRALGSRSILGDPRSEKMQSVMNLKIKFRESFRPFAPSVMKEKSPEYFELKIDNPYMLFVSPVVNKRLNKLDENYDKLFGIEKLNVPRSDIPAVTHVDNSARLQTVSEQSNPVFYELIKSFYNKTGCAVLINTSFNVRGEPIVCTPEDAFKCFLRTNMDYLVLGNYLLDRKDQNQGNVKIGDLSEFQPD